MKISERWLNNHFASEKLVSWFRKEFNDKKAKHKKVLDRLSVQGCSSEELNYLISEGIWLLENLKDIDDDIILKSINSQRTIFIAGNLKCDSLKTDKSVYITGNLHCKSHIFARRIICGNNISCKGMIESEWKVESTNGSIESKYSITIKDGNISAPNGDIKCNKNINVKGIITAKNVKAKGNIKCKKLKVKGKVKAKKVKERNP